MASRFGASLEGKWCAALAFMVAVVLLTPAAGAQDDTVPRVEVFGGYAWFDPNDQVSVFTLESAEKGFGISSTYNFTRNFGWTVDTGVHWEDNYKYGTITTGPKLTWRSEGLQPFAQATVGLARLAHSGFETDNGIALTAGGGLDLKAHPRFSVRLIQADYVYSHHNFFPAPNPTTNINGARLRAGIVINFGSLEPPTPPSARCTAQPTSVMAGEPVQVSVTTSDFKPGRTLNYEWSASGGQVEGTGETVRVNTQGLAPGSYTVTARVSERKNLAECSAGFSIQEPPRNPPTISCSANPTTVQTGERSTITCNVTNPDQRPLSYDWSATGGRVTGRETTGTLDTTGAGAGPITVTTTVSDDRGLSATARTTVNVEVPPPPPQASRLNEIQFQRNSARVDNQAKAILDDVALRLQRDADATAVIIGYADADERRAENLAAQRAVNAKAYLTQERGIDPNRIELRTGTGGGMRAEIWIVPAGATFTGEGTQAVDESKFKPTRR